MLTLFESLYKVCISMFSPWIWKKINKSHAHHIYVANEIVGLSSCQTIELTLVWCIDKMYQFWNTGINIDRMMIKTI